MNPTSYNIEINEIFSRAHLDTWSFSLIIQHPVQTMIPIAFQRSVHTQALPPVSWLFMQIYSQRT